MNARRGLSGSSVPPSFARGVPGDLSPLLGTQGGGPGATTLQSAEPAERRGVRVALKDRATAAQHFEPLGGRMAALAFPANLIGSFRLVVFANPLTYETLTPHGEDHNLHPDRSRKRDACRP
jgi:hypothetical protein